MDLVAVIPRNAVPRISCGLGTVLAGIYPAGPKLKTLKNYLMVLLCLGEEKNVISAVSVK